MNSAIGFWFRPKRLNTLCETKTVILNLLTFITPITTLQQTAQQVNFTNIFKHFFCIKEWAYFFWLKEIGAKATHVGEIGHRTSKFCKHCSFFTVNAA